ncbi:MAG TPA: FAD-dependent oxidoreductase [Pyrinomonadaceae bacterium]|nr:FAD-dependent oxidoreductase [Pyrinomonadaceae bacterium]
MTNVAVIGGGPGGLMTAYLLNRKYKGSCQTTIFEATDRVGGKIQTRRFDSVPAPYESGVAEVYDYGLLGRDPLQQLIAELGLKTTPVEGQTVVLNGEVLSNDHEIREHCGESTLKAILDFRHRAASMMPIEAWYEGLWQADNKHPWAQLTCEEVLDEVADPTARKYLKVAVHSDLATELHLTNGLNGLKNFVMDVPGYVRQFSIVGGMEMLPKALREKLAGTRVELNAPVVSVSRRNESYRVCFRRGREVFEQEFDAVFVALPHNWLNSVEWGGERLRRAMTRHIAYYDRPAHYLRVSILFKKPFWRERVAGSWFMLDAFGGCCVYDESARHDAGGYGVLGWLLAGSDALARANLNDHVLVDGALDSLPDDLTRTAREQFIEGKVHRWVAAVNGQPGGLPLRDARSAHLPEPSEHPNLFIVGDYLFDSTLNGVFDSANFATDLPHSLIETRQSINPMKVSNLPVICLPATQSLPLHT